MERYHYLHPQHDSDHPGVSIVRVDAAMLAGSLLQPAAAVSFLYRGKYDRWGVVSKEHKKHRHRYILRDLTNYG